LADSAQAGKREPAQSADPAYQLARLCIIIFILAVAGLAGLHFKSQASPGSAPSGFRMHSPLYVNVFGADVSSGGNFVPIPVRVYVSLQPEKSDVLPAKGFAYYRVAVGVSATPIQRTPQQGPILPGPIFITSSIAPSGDEWGRINVIPVKHAPGGQQQFVTEFRSNLMGQALEDTIYFDSVPVIFEDNGSAFGHLPSVGTLVDGVQVQGWPTSPGAAAMTYPPLFMEYDRTGKPRFATLDYAPPNARWAAGADEPDVSPWITTPGDRGEFFDVPSQISYTETVRNIAPVLAGQAVDYMAPATDNTNNNDYTWHSGTSLEPVFKYTDPDATDSQSRAAFYSGIAFGVAGSALIALVQEIRDDRKSRSSAQLPPSART
jgi:hypothetical protein